MDQRSSGDDGESTGSVLVVGMMEGRGKRRSGGERRREREKTKRRIESLALLQRKSLLPYLITN